MEATICKRCQCVISQDRLAENPVICNHCGHTSDSIERHQTEMFQKHISKVMVVGGFVVMALFAHIVSWEKHSFRIVPLKFKVMAGIGDRESLLEVASVCENRMKYTCTLNAYESILEKHPNDLETLEKLAKLQNLMGQNQLAMASLKKYFDLDGQSSIAAHRYALLLTTHGDQVQADKYFKRALELKPEVLQVTVIQDYVRFLKQQARYKDAHDLIYNFRKSGAPNNFLSQEFRELDFILKQSS